MTHPATVRERLAALPAAKQILYRVLMSRRLARPRWFVRMLAPFYQKRALSSKIYRSVRMDTPPFRLFSIGARSVVESFSCVNNAVGDVVIGRDTRIGLHSTIIGPVRIGSDVMLAQGVVVSGLNHVFSSEDIPVSRQGIETDEVTIADGAWIGANAVVTAGVRIGRNAVVAAGAVVTKDVEDGSVVAGVPARPIRKKQT